MPEIKSIPSRTESKVNNSFRYLASDQLAELVKYYTTYKKIKNVFINIYFITLGIYSSKGFIKTDENQTHLGRIKGAISLRKRKRNIKQMNNFGKYKLISNQVNGKIVAVKEEIIITIKPYFLYNLLFRIGKTVFSGQ